jgi:hypothetical protein
MELKRRQLRAIDSGDLCTMKFLIKQRHLESDDYRANGNIVQSTRNYMKKIHIADVDTFYCSNGGALDNKEFIEIIPVVFDHDNYKNHSIAIALSQRFKVIVSRDDMNIVAKPTEHLDFSDINSIIRLFPKKYNTDISIWERRIGK